MEKTGVDDVYNFWVNLLMKLTLKYGIEHSILAAGYVTLVATLLQNGHIIFGEKDNALMPVAFLLLFVVSAAVMGMLVLGRPILWYLDGKKREAVELVGVTIASLAAITVLVFLFLALVS